MTGPSRFAAAGRARSRLSGPMLSGDLPRPSPSDHPRRRPATAQRVRRARVAAQGAGLAARQRTTIDAVVVLSDWTKPEIGVLE
jgi:hypothetical protein